MKYLLLTLLLFCCCGAYAQNLVPNGSFEQHYFCPDNLGEVDSCIGWQTILNTPDYFATCAPYPASVPSNAAGYQTPFEGNAYIGLITYAWSNYYREIAGTKLVEELIPGNIYRVSMRVSRGNWTNMSYNCSASNNIGIRFTSYNLPLHPNITTNDEIPYVNNVPQLNEDSIITDTLNWILLHWNYIPDSAYTHLYIGNFFDDAHTDTSVINAPLGQFGIAYYFIDSINVICTSNSCLNGITNVSINSMSMLYENDSKILLIQMDNELGVLQIVNAAGQLIKKIKINGASQINLSELKSDFYIATLKTEKRIITKKIIIN